MAKKLKLGDIFYIEIVKDKFVFGKVLFDVDKQYRKKVNLQKTDSINSSNNLKGWYVGCVVIEMYYGVYDNVKSIASKEILIKRAICTIDGLRNQNWGVFANEMIDVQQVSFPETLILSNDFYCIDFGELEFKTTLTEKDYDKIDVPTSRIDITSVADMCLNIQGFSNLLQEDYQKEESMAMYDLMYHPAIRNKIYKELNLDPNKSYYELSKELGFDLKRFYE